MEVGEVADQARGGAVERIVDARPETPTAAANADHEVLSQHSVRLPGTCVAIRQETGVVPLQRVPHKLGANCLEDDVLARGCR